ncbi:MAG: peptidylprolyl isomerase [Oscillospiraceae bacterium]
MFKNRKSLLKFFGITITSILLITTFSSCFYMDILSAERFEAIDEEKINFIQLEKVKAGDEIGIITTSLGTFKIKLFTNESPNAVKNFKELVSSGYYNGYKISKISQNKAFISTDSNGNGKSIFGEPFQNQYSNNLWHFPGAVSSISDKEGYGDSRFLVVSNSTITEDIFGQMVQSNFPQKVIQKYRELGGAPEYDRGCSIFAQVFDGMDIVNLITSKQTNSDGLVSEDLIINSITLATFEE